MPEPSQLNSCELSRYSILLVRHLLIPMGPKYFELLSKQNSAKDTTLEASFR